MSDREGRSAPSDDDLSLPRATVAKMIQGTGHLHPIFHFPPPIFFNASHLSVMGVGLHEVTLNSLFPPFLGPRRDGLELLPEDVTCAKDTRDLVIECCVGKLKISIPLWR